MAAPVLARSEGGRFAPKARPLHPEPERPVLSPERAKLAETIERCTAAQAQIDRIREAKDKAHRATLAAYRGIEAAETVVAQARADEPRRQTDLLLGDPTDSTGLDEAQSALEAARTALRLAREAEQLVNQEVERAERGFEWAISARRNALREVALGSPETAQLLAAYHATRTYAASIHAALQELSVHNLLANQWNNERDYQPDPGLAAVWREAVASLTTDAAAPWPAVGVR